MKHIERYLSPEWQALVKAAIRKFFPEREELWCTDFGTDLVITFEDDSSMNLKNAIFLKSYRLGETVIFTEHLGYMAFYTEMIKSIDVKECYPTELKFNTFVEDIL